MAKAFTPGLTVTARTTYRARRVLPITGDVLVARGAQVKADTVVAQTFMEGDAFPMRAANILSANPKDLPGRTNRALQRHLWNDEDRGEVRR
jgi:hypothetical protein